MYLLFYIVFTICHYGTTPYSLRKIEANVPNVQEHRVKRDGTGDQTINIINDALTLHYYPNNFTINQMPLPMSNCTLIPLDHFFYLANILGVLNQPVDENSCLSFCNLNPKCSAINYLPDKKLCFLLGSGLTMTDIREFDPHDAVFNVNLNSRHYLITKCYDDSGKLLVKIPSAPVPLPEPPELAGQCGVAYYQPVVTIPVTNRIVGGTTAVPHSWPWIVSLQVDGAHFCGGTVYRVITGAEETDLVLTAAHCVTDSNGEPETLQNFAVKLGAQSQSIGEEGAIRMPVDKFIVHPQYDPSLLINDVAILLLKRPVKFSKTILPVCLARSGEVPPVGTTCVDVGWGNIINISAPGGYPDLLQQLKVNVLDDATCSRPDVWGLAFNPKTSICAGYLEGKRNVCSGDSGGPLLCKSTDKWKQFGVASFVGRSGCAVPMKPGVFARVSTYSQWIMQMSSILTRVGKTPRR